MTASPCFPVALDTFGDYDLILDGVVIDGGRDLACLRFHKDTPLYVAEVNLASAAKREAFIDDLYRSVGDEMFPAPGAAYRPARGYTILQARRLEREDVRVDHK